MQTEDQLLEGFYTHVHSSLVDIEKPLFGTPVMVESKEKEVLQT